LFEKYINMNIDDRPIVVGMDAKTGRWYCKEAVAKDPLDSGRIMGEMNIELNKVNKGAESKK